MFDLIKVGGKFDAAGEKEATVYPIDNPKTLAQYEEVKKLWATYQQQLQILGQENADYQALSDFAAAQQENVYTAVDNMVVSLTDDYRQTAREERYIQMAGVGLLVAFFGVFVFYFIRQMQKADVVLEKARQETRDILDSVSEGLFLLDKDMNVGHQHSRALEEILGQQRVAGNNFFEMASDMLTSDKKRNALKLFVEQLYNARVVEKLIAGLNPLRRVEVQNNNEEPRTLTFNFSRVVKDNAISKVLVSVRDITDAARLEEQLQREQEQANQQAEMISHLMNADYSMMAAFLRGAVQTLNDINTTLKQPENNEYDLREKAKSIARDIHGIKGEASALKLKLIVSKAEVFEDAVKKLMDKDRLVGNDFLGAVVDLEGLLTLVLQAREWHSKMQPSEATGSQKTSAAQTSIAPFFEKFVQEIASRHNKIAALDARGMEYFDQHPDKLQAWKDVLIQLLRNSVVHGIEQPEERAALSKSREGTVKLFVEQNGGNVRLIVEDDGKGLDFELIRAKAAQMGLASEQELAAWEHSRLLQLIFEPGFTTRTHSDEDAGRGVGMDIVKERINQLHAKFKVHTVSKQFTRFVIDL
ncbi:ATP-binding protein [Kingella negevensis]|uniref:Chemotaxis protein CheA n=1 Tax=Kingella negevensis TaxID=1522312 RepID=A0A238TBY4_9NEIS|nr:ATP-binding protein [Kingella negevensis]MDK4684892.1 ATP-binding protein [Kingella negevensis]MDK4698073.1 ATP-binding protein [Kingella negevensis]MDK4707138.1 ATP-binding protein [Kingella negevensis]MDK4710716.1 ATP-binding protein [Kingella negevensis]SNB62602.1 Chemotaxis protein CheA [Kingella negevensis]